MPMLDVFNQDAFSVQSLTAAINKLPFQPSLLGSMNLFQMKGINTTSAVVEERHGKLSLIPQQARGTMPLTGEKITRQARAFLVPHLPILDAVQADDVQNMRAFGSETQIETVSSAVNDKLEQMRQDFETTHEWHRAGAIQGNVLDADGTTVIYNWFTEFGITENVVAFDFGVGVQDMKLKSLEVLRAVEDSLGGTTYNAVTAFCGNAWYDLFISHATVKDAFERFQDNVFAREQQFRRVFNYAGIDWINYRGQIGAQPFIPTDEARFVPVGVPDLLQQINAPADFIETVNTTGLNVYVKQERMRFDKGVELHGQSNPLFIANRPGSLIKGTDVTT